MTIKTEMNGTGGGRWTSRDDAKTTSKSARRRNDRTDIDEQLAAELDSDAAYDEWVAGGC